MLGYGCRLIPTLDRGNSTSIYKERGQRSKYYYGTICQSQLFAGDGSNNMLKTWLHFTVRQSAISGTKGGVYQFKLSLNNPLTYNVSARTHLYMARICIVLS